MSLRILQFTCSKSLVQSSYLAVWFLDSPSLHLWLDSIRFLLAKCEQGWPTVIVGGSSGPNPRLGRIVPSGTPHTKLSSKQAVWKRRGERKELCSVHQPS
ncbi:hypothetical protein GOODEAATRI_028544 [Goodea atripinnis]|uniref:Uncharacterized protein n=1 Tax=Goodea atripinnis TaxID=208336 RepID=A0ABV0NP24_9TELE